MTLENFLDLALVGERRVSAAHVDEHAPDTERDAPRSRTEPLPVPEQRRRRQRNLLAQWWGRS